MKVRKPKNLSDLFDMLENLEDIYNKGKINIKEYFETKTELINLYGEGSEKNEII